MSFHAYDTHLNPPLEAKGVRHRIRRWWYSRLSPTDTLLLTQRNLYIVPTRVGLMLAGTLLLLLVSSINYQLNLGYLLTFLLAGSALIGMHVGHATLRGLTLKLQSPQPQFLGHAITLDIHLNNPGKNTRYGISLGVVSGNKPSHHVWADVPAQSSTTIQIAFQASRRGHQVIPLINAQTRFPLGTFHIWTIWRPAAQILIYPAVEVSPPPLPLGEAHPGGNTAQRFPNSGEFEGVRAYQRGDPLKQVVWKKAAKTNELVSRDNRHQQHLELWLDFFHAGAIPTEQKLSRLCAWVVQAEQLSMEYGLRLPTVEIAPGSGEAHKRRCLEALALC